MFQSFAGYQPFQNQQSGIKAQNSSIAPNTPDANAPPQQNTSGPATSMAVSGLENKATKAMTNSSADAHQNLISNLANKGNPVAQEFMGNNGMQSTLSGGNDAGITYAPSSGSDWMQSILGTGQTAAPAAATTGAATTGGTTGAATTGAATTGAADTTAASTTGGSSGSGLLDWLWA